MLSLEHSVILLTFIKLPFVIEIFVLTLTFFEWPFFTCFTVSELCNKRDNLTKELQENRCYIGKKKKFLKILDLFIEIAK